VEDGPVGLWRVGSRALSVLDGPGSVSGHLYVEGFASVLSIVAVSAVASTVRERTDVRLSWGAVA
jgi:hypothetical protein